MYQSDPQQHSSYFMNMNNNTYQQPLKPLPATTENMALHYFCSDSVSSEINNNFTFLDNTISSSTTMIHTTTSQSHTPKYHRISSIASIGSTISTTTPSTATPSKRKSKKNRKSRRNNRRPDSLQSYDPVSTHRAQGRIQISKAMTEKIIPALIKEKITDLYIYMDKSVALCDNNFVTDQIKVIDFDFHDKKTDERLYCVAQKQDDTQKSSRGYEWKMIDKLFTANSIYKQYNIQNVSLLKSVRNSNKFKNELKDAEKIKQFLMDGQQWQKLLKKAKWCKTDVLTKVNNKRRITLSVTKTEFMKSCNEFMNNSKHSKLQLLPIVMFSSSEFKYWVEHVWIVRLEQEQIDIGIAFKYDNDRKTVMVRGIHLDRDYILRQHQLAVPQHKCNCLDGFQSSVNDFQIGNPDDDKNRIKYYKQQIEELQKRLEAFEDKNKSVIGICEDKPEVLNIETTCLFQQESDNYYFNNNELDIVENDESIYYNIPQTPRFD